MNSVFRCWNCSSPLIFKYTKKQEEKFILLCKSNKRVCPKCKPINHPLVIVSGHTLYNAPKAYKCQNGHLVLVSMFGNGEIAILKENNGEYIKNSDLVTESCKFDCGPLEEVDSYILTPPSLSSFKTKTRIGDIWDKGGVESVKSIDDEGNPHWTRKRRVEQLNKMKKRIIPEERLPGKPI